MMTRDHSHRPAERLVDGATERAWLAINAYRVSVRQPRTPLVADDAPGGVDKLRLFS